MKTVYIPAGATYNYETLVTDDVIVHGHLHVTNGLKAKHISGRGFIIRLRTIMAMILLSTRVAAVSASMIRMELYRVRQLLSLCIIRNA